jgi:hypothetical protein
VGLKLTFMVYVVGMTVALPFVVVGWSGRIKAEACWIGSLIVGALVTSGHWMLAMWSHFRNPLFPYYNNIFKSPYTELAANSDDRYLPKTLGDALTYPFHMLSRTQFTYLSLDFRDSRYAIIYVLLLILLVIWGVRRFGKNPESETAVDTSVVSAAEKLLLIFLAVSYVVWQMKFSIVRYLVPAEAIGGVAILLMIRRIFQPANLRYLTAGIAMVLMLVIFKAEGFERLPWSSKFFDVQVPEIESPSNALVVIAGSRPWAYVIPFFPTGPRYVRVESNLTGPTHQTKLQSDMRDIIRNHNGPIYLLSKQGYVQHDVETLKAYQLSVQGNQGKPIYSKHESPGLGLWPLTRGSQG